MKHTRVANVVSATVGGNTATTTVIMTMTTIATAVEVGTILLKAKAHRKKNGPLTKERPVLNSSELQVEPRTRSRNSYRI